MKVSVPRYFSAVGILKFPSLMHAYIASSSVLTDFSALCRPYLPRALCTMVLQCTKLSFNKFLWSRRYMSPLTIYIKSYDNVQKKKSVLVMPSCGATVTQNLTYLVQDATTNPTTKVCAYTLCPVSESVNRIRLDFTVCNYFFNISVN